MNRRNTNEVDMDRSRHFDHWRLGVGIVWLLFVLLSMQPSTWAAECGWGWSWRSVPTPQGENLSKIAWNGSLFVAVGPADAGGQGVILTSPDGESWTRRTSGTRNSLRAVAWSGSLFVAVGDGGTVLASADGKDWSAQSSGTTKNLRAVTWAGNTFIAAGDAGTLLNSADGKAWTAQSSGTTNNLRALGFNNNSLIFNTIAVGDRGTILVYSGNGWVPQVTGTTRNLRDVVVADSSVLVVGDGGTLLASGFGIDWRSVSSGITNNLVGITWRNGVFVAVGDGGVILTGGEAWSSETPDKTVNLSGIVEGSNGRFVAVGNGGKLVIGGDQLWDKQSSGTTSRLRGVTRGGNLFVAVGDNGAVLTSQDATVWTHQSAKITNAFSAVAWGSGKYVITGDSGTVLTSLDGTEWAVQSSGTTYNLRGVAWGGQFVAVGDHGTILTSPDGITWIRQTSGTLADLRKVTWHDGQFVAVGDTPERLTILTSQDGAGWATRYYETNGVASANFNDITWGGGQFLTVGGTFYNGYKSPAIQTSVDGIFWTPQSTNVRYYQNRYFGSSGNFKGVAWGAGRFVAVGDDGIQTSPDGITWNRGGSIEKLLGVVWGADQFVSVGDDGAIFTHCAPADAAGNSSWSTEPVPFTPQPVGTASAARAVTLTNTEAKAYAIQSITASDDFTVTDDCGASLPVGASCKLLAVFTPKSLGPHSGTLTVTRSDGKVLTRKLMGTGISPNNADLSVSIAARPSVQLGKKLKYTVKVRNLSAIKATNLTLFAELQNGASFVRHPRACEVIRQSLSCHFKGLRGKQTRLLTVTVKPESRVNLGFSVRATADTNDPNPINDSVVFSSVVR